MKIEIIKSMTEIDRKVWNSFVDDPSYLWGWLMALEESSKLNNEQEHRIVYNKGKIIGIMPFFKQNRGLLYSFHESVYPYIYPAINFTPFSLVGVHANYTPGTHISRYFGEKKKLAVQKILDKISDRNFVMFPFCEESDDMISHLEKNGFSKVMFNINTTLDLREFGKFEDYVKKIKKNRKIRIVKELRVPLEKGIKFSIVNNIHGYEERASELYEQTFKKYIRFKINPLSPELLVSMQKYMKENIKFILAFKGSKLVSFSVFFVHKGTILTYQTGRDYELTKETYAYFNACYYKPIEYAIQNGFKTLVNGPASYDCKIYRGFRLNKLYLMIRSNNFIKQKGMDFWLKIYANMRRKENADVLNLEKYIIKKHRW